ncbi:MAG: hypothetical protein QXS20_10625 [Candidatus Thorarchaeota archaeon]
MQYPFEIGLLRLDLLLEALAGTISLMISHKARVAFRLTDQKKLSDLSVGFLVLSASMYGRVLGTILILEGILEEPSTPTVIIAYATMRAMAYLLFGLSTLRLPERSTSLPVTILALPILISPALDMIAVLILIVVILQSLLNYLSVRSSYAALVLVGFTFLLLSHISVLLYSEPLRGYFLSQLFQFIGLAFFFIMTVRAGRGN